MKTIPRNHTRKIAAIKAKNLTCRLHEVGRDYPADVNPSYAWDHLDEYSFARLWVNSDGDVWTVRVHGNLWFELREVPE